MKKIIILIISLPIVLLSCNNNRSVQSENSQIKYVENFIVQYYEVMSSRDWSAYQELFAEKATLTTIWRDSTETKRLIFTNTISEFVAQTANGPDSQPIFEEKPLKIDIEIKNNLAAVWVEYGAKFGRENELIEWKGYDLFSLINFEGNWKIASLTYTELGN